MITPMLPSGGRAAQARLNAEKAAEHPSPQAPVEADPDTTASAWVQRLVQISDEMSAALTQFRARRQFELKPDSLPDNLERVLDDDPLPKVRQLLRLAPLADASVASLLTTARKLFADDSDLAWVLRELLRRKTLDETSRQRLEALLQAVVDQASAKRLNAGINAALKARLFGAGLVVRAALLRETYRDFLESEDGPLDSYQHWIALYGPARRLQVLAFIEAALLTDIGAQDPSCSRLEFGQMLARLNELKRLRSAEAQFIGGLLGDSLIRRHNPEETDWLVFLLGLLTCPDELDEWLFGVLGDSLRSSPHPERSTLLNTVRRFSLQLPLSLFADAEAPQRLAQQFTRLADIAFGHEGRRRPAGGDT
ncbi:type III secretion system gatekeeper subunit SctW [Pseudomonas fluorescens]|jgi:type III secretion protein W|uniref:type III secretion system gatekeeper subunit SctW n=1 Tax=Pseudomonas fluorescens TaxID=294 RepID=UPI003526AEF6